MLSHSCLQPARQIREDQEDHLIQFLQVWPTNPCVWNALRPLLTIWGLDFLPLNLLSRGSGGQAPSCPPGSTGTARTAEPTPVQGTAFPREPNPAPQGGRKTNLVVRE